MPRPAQRDDTNLLIGHAAYRLDDHVCCQHDRNSACLNANMLANLYGHCLAAGGQDAYVDACQALLVRYAFAIIHQAMAGAVETCTRLRSSDLCE